ncbi:hypothetical protein Clacol_006231 [Clathrus columnatus]|uniref:3-hydroxyisobutyrate dehydrogenase n=1 Tax=Clathrus columnatus TaxID=1419009 RepID=A0AAV5AFT8_9AGAM|nr:hypothetical protein Clacol_006231 [Clathrus columnatus]
MKFSLRCFHSAAKSSVRNNIVGFIGLGQMGHAMATNWVKKRVTDNLHSNEKSGFVVYDIDTSRTVSFAQSLNEVYSGANISVASNPAEVASASQIVLTMLPSSPHVKEAYYGNQGILSGLQTLSNEAIRNTLCIDSTTLDVNVARDVARSVKHLGSSMVDAPVSGGVAGAKAGTLSFLVGGTFEEYTQASPILALMGSRIIHCGDSGAGLAAKICNNLVLGVQQVVVGEAMLLGQRLGLDPAVLAGVINSSTGGCWASSVNNPVRGALPGKAPPCERDYEGGFLTSLMLKDMKLAIEIGKSTGTSLPLGRSAETVYNEVVEKHEDLAKKDFSSVYKFLERKSDSK